MVLIEDVLFLFFGGPYCWGVGGSGPLRLNRVQHYRATTCVVGIVNLLTKSPDPPSSVGGTSKSAFNEDHALRTLDFNIPEVAFEAWPDEAKQ